MRNTLMWLVQAGDISLWGGGGGRGGWCPSLFGVAPNQSWRMLWGGRCKLEGFPRHSPPIYISFIKTVSNLGQKFRACMLPPIAGRRAIAGRRPLRCFKSQGDFHQGRLGPWDSPVAWLPADTRWAPPGLYPEGGRAGHRERRFC